MARRFHALEADGDPHVDRSLPPWAGRALLGLTLFQVGEVAASAPMLDEARAMSAAWAPDEGTSLPALVHVVALDEALSSGRPPEDERLQQALRRLAGDEGEQLSQLRNIHASRLLRRGDLLAARDVLDEGLSLSRATGSAPSLLLRLCLAVRIDAMRGDLPALTTEARELRQLSRRLGYTWGLSFAHRMQGLLALAEGRLDDALGFLEPLLDEDLLLGLAPAQPVLLGRADLVEVLVRVGAPERARAVHDQVRQTLAGLDDAFAAGMLARTGALLATGDDAAGGLARALVDFGHAGEAFEQARTQLLLGEQLRRDRRTGEARDALRAAAGAFERMGALPWLTRATEELRAAGAAAPVQGTPGTTGQLTAQERRVADAVARGMSNREAAAALFVSPRTVEHHLASAYRKLGVRGRTALAACLLAEEPAGRPEAR
jgi:DNA-binding CsgD family transcriptional regulator